MKTTVTMVLLRETKGSYLYQELDDQERPLENYNPKCKVGTMYIKKRSFEKRTNKIQVTIDTLEG